MKRIGLLSPALASLVCLLVTVVAAAQNPQPTQGTQPQPSQPGGQAIQPQTGPASQSQPTDADRRFSFHAGAAGAAMQAGRRSPDAELAGCLTVDNEGEVHAGQFAQQRAQNDEVKKFAAEMVAAHGQMIQKLQRFTDAGQTTRSTIGTTGVGPDDRNATNTAIAPTTSGSASAGGQSQAAMQTVGQSLDHLALKRELGELCKQTFEREFSQKSGAEFDKCYLGQQIGATPTRHRRHEGGAEPRFGRPAPGT